MAEQILKSKRFLPLMLTQFLGALNDNMFKNALLLMVTVKMASKAAVLSNVIAALFILPFFLFSATAGEFADKYDKGRVARVLKITELLLMISALIVFYAQSLWGLIILLGCMGAQSAFFGPVKYALLPEHLKQDEYFARSCFGNNYADLLGSVAFNYFFILWFNGFDVYSGSSVGASKCTDQEKYLCGNGKYFESDLSKQNRLSLHFGGNLVLDDRGFCGGSNLSAFWQCFKCIQHGYYLFLDFVFNRGGHRFGFLRSLNERFCSCHIHAAQCTCDGYLFLCFICSDK